MEKEGFKFRKEESIRQREEFARRRQTELAEAEG
jgi:hypothetical protein